MLHYPVRLTTEGERVLVDFRISRRLILLGTRGKKL